MYFVRYTNVTVYLYKQLFFKSTKFKHLEWSFSNHFIFRSFCFCSCTNTHKTHYRKNLYFAFCNFKMNFLIFLIMCIYTNGKKKQCTAKMLITHKICSGWPWKFINMVSPIQTFHYQTFTRFHVRLVRHLFFLWKLHFMSSATEKQHATKLIDAKRKFMELLFRKPLYFC